jgi:hypothetical protein
LTIRGASHNAIDKPVFEISVRAIITIKPVAAKRAAVKSLMFNSLNQRSRQEDPQNGFAAKR